ncbi:MAG: hypothetical protein IPL39_10575 [Opitutaceae bacterium]|nr:hypothetical protein [Opitutaceae bacterium]
MSSAPPLPAATIDEVLTLVRSACAPLDPERVPLAAALGRVLRETVTTPEDQPPFTRSAVDGYAVRLDDASTEFRIVDTLRAGDWRPRTLKPGEAVRLATGAALPGDSLQVVMREDAALGDGTVRPLRRDRETHIRERGEDAQAGQALVSAPARLSAGSLALLASVGAAAPLVTRLPRVLHLATGNEIVPPDHERPPLARSATPTPPSSAPFWPQTASPLPNTECRRATTRLWRSCTPPPAAPRPPICCSSRAGRAWANTISPAACSPTWATRSSCARRPPARASP